jgi:hypothetical protein
MKNFVILILILLTAVSCSKVDPVSDMGLTDELTLKSKPINQGANAIDLNGPHFELNLLGKKDNWNDKTVDNPTRHTMFIPRNTASWAIYLEQNNIVINHKDTVGQNVGTLPGVRIDMTQGSEFAVLDGTVFDGDGCEFQLGPGKYQVYVAARGKKKVSPAQIDAWLEALQETLDVDADQIDSLWYYLNLGTITVKRNWQDMTDLFYIDEDEAYPLPYEGGPNGQWIFDYMTWLETQVIEIDWNDDQIIDEIITYSELAYFWQLQNNGSQLIKVRFYPVES